MRDLATKLTYDPLQNVHAVIILNLFHKSLDELEFIDLREVIQSQLFQDLSL